MSTASKSPPPQEKKKAHPAAPDLQIRDVPNELAVVDTTKRQFAVCDRCRSRGLKGHGDEVLWDQSLCEEIVRDCRDGRLTVLPKVMLEGIKRQVCGTNTTAMCVFLIRYKIINRGPCSPQYPVTGGNTLGVRGNTYGLLGNSHIRGNRHGIKILSTWDMV